MDASSLVHVVGNPREHCRAWLSASRPAGDALLRVDFDLPCHWLPGVSSVALTALYMQRAGRLEVAVLPAPLEAANLPAGEQFDTWVADQRAHVAIAGEPLPLESLVIGKPWGLERWFTGAERRGVCAFGKGERRTPQPWLLAALPDAGVAPGHRAPMLLKLLEPSAEPVAGDLYFELHEVKQELYVVTHVDQRAWPDGVGYLRFGFCPRRLAGSETEAVFRQEYLSAVLAYRRVREKIDNAPEGIQPTTGVMAEEARLRAEMDAYTRLKPVRVGDVVEIPRLLPHALQHGVHVVEFQTPVFERKILSFAQRVLTQEHWDTEQAVAIMRLLPPLADGVQLLVEEPGARVEKLAATPELELRRVRLGPGRRLPVAVTGDHGLVVVLEGRLDLAGNGYGPGQAAWLPPDWRGEIAAIPGVSDLVLLLAIAGR